eukprot:scaffold651106_cov51-Prasinocladus_malaysianus.AAC.1
MDAPFNYDIALLRLDRPADVFEVLPNTTIPTLATANLVTGMSAGQNLTVVGWGLTSELGNVAE